MSTAEIEGIEYLNNPLQHKFILQSSQKVERHPDADKLTLCEVDTGKKTPGRMRAQQTIKTGDIVAFATVGTKFSDEFIIKKSKKSGE
jgi:phenylalanyl-tRNA synthetase beta chain